MRKKRLFRQCVNSMSKINKFFWRFCMDLSITSSSVSSAAVWIEAGPSLTLKSAPQRRPSSEWNAMRKSRLLLHAGIM